MELNFTVTNQKIKYVSNLYIVEKSRNYLTAKFSFSGNEWKNVVKTAIFKKDDTVINVVLDESGRCDVPWEVITKGTLKVSVFGGDLVTVDTADVKILKSGYEEGNAPSEPTPDVYAQILTELQDIRSEYVTEEMLGQAVEDWLAENVVEALSPEDVQKIVYGWLEEHKTELKGEKGDSGENGIDGKDGVDGKNGITFTPIIVDGVLSWENNGELDNPTSFDFNEELGINTIKSDVETLKDKKDITTTDSTTQPNSYAGREMVLEIGGVTEQGENPSPTNPQEIKKSVVKGVKTHHKNFWTFGDIKIGASTNLEWNIPAGTYTFSCSNSAPALLIRVFYTDESNELISLDKSVTTFTLNKDVYKFNFSTSSADDITNIQVEEGTEATPYEPYTESSYTFSQPIKLYGKDGVQDVITPKEINHNLYVKVFDGTEDILMWSTSNGYIFGYDSSNIAINSTNALTGAKCSHFVEYQNDYLWANSIDGFSFSQSVGRVMFRSATLGFTTTEEVKAQLKEWYDNGNPMVVVCDIATPTTEALPIADQIGLNSLVTYDGITYVEFIYEGLEPTFKGKYGTSEVGGMTLESLLVARKNELKQELANERLSALEASVVNNI